MPAQTADALSPRPDADAARKHYSRGRDAETKLDRWTAIEAFRQALTLNPEDCDTCFRLGYNLDLVGEELEALSLYERACNGGQAKLNALLNLAVLYEDHGHFSKAERCIKLVVDTDPNHARGRLFLKDILASRGMVVEEDAGRAAVKGDGALETPVTDFELSARARNCLKKMNIRTLGDLLRVSEPELMAYKNFGETTLAEIKNMLQQKGLRLGQALDQQRDAARQQVYDQLLDTAGEEAVGILGKSVDELELSVRSRKALSLLSVQTIGDLVARTEAELLGIKNFGQTSLDEIQIKLTEMSLSLRKIDDAEPA
jgi:DNA-directed RNA polymerase subunit alpha